MVIISNTQYDLLFVSSCFFVSLKNIWSDKKCWRGCGEKENLAVENSMEVPQKPKNIITIWFINPIPGTKWKKIIIQKHTCTPIFIVALFTIAGSWKKPKCPSTDEWMKKMRYIYTMEYYSAIIKKNEIMPFSAIWIWLQIIILSEVSQKEKHEYHMIPLICRIWSMMKINLPMKQKHLQREQICGCHGG